MSNSVRAHRRQPTRLRRPWDSPVKNTGVGCHFLLQYMKVKSESEITQSCPTLRDPMDCSLPGSSVHGIFQARNAGVGCHCLLQIISYINIFRIFLSCVIRSPQDIQKNWQKDKHYYLSKSKILFVCVVQLYINKDDIFLHYRLLQDIDYNSLCYTINLSCLFHIYFFNQKYSILLILSQTNGIKMS